MAEARTRPQIVTMLGRRFVAGAPDGFCPWGEARCDEMCEPYAGCRLEREEV